jgi:hypothetical protein
MVPPVNDLAVGMIEISFLFVLLLDETSRIIEKMISKMSNEEAMTFMYSATATPFNCDG